MHPINWQQFGLKKDPYDTLPLIEGGDLPIEEAFVGRTEEQRFLDALLESENRLCLTILGDVGVGKTSLANFQKFIWKYDKPKLLFSFRREIEASDSLLNKSNFLIEIIGSVLREIRLLDGNLLKHDLLNSLNQIVDVTQSSSISASVGGSVYGFGANLGLGNAGAITQPIQLSIATLERYFSELIKFIKETPIAGLSYSGLIIHVNNFDVVSADPSQKKKVIGFFNEIRDILQTPDTYFLFLGPKHFFKDIISSQQRVKSIFFQTPLKINPLSKSEIIQAFNGRMELLKSDDVAEYIKPIADEVVYRLYDLYKGDIRSVMTGIRDILGQHSERLTQPLSVADAMLLLGQGRWDRIEQVVKLTSEQKKVLHFFIKSEQYISQRDVSKFLEIAQPNVSGYYFKPLKEAGIIEEKERKGRELLWGLSIDYLPLKWLIEEQKIATQAIKEQAEQLSFFDKI
ncbi:hypothetical protein HZA43_00025 [Candidatus Peregrinibacteria bacterium]|nr:hypothetical protein [Candidatus Peregrinibacteria bacterium]